jgi:hypothetical protein
MVSHERLRSPVFFQVSPNTCRPPMVSLVSVTISTDKTVVWVDHWEDGFDDDVTIATARTTEIWGDGNATNGCSPMITSCTNALDVLMAGASIVIQNLVNLPRVKTEIRYDGGDRIQSSFPIAVTRAGYSSTPGSVFAGAGTSFCMLASVVTEYESRSLRLRLSPLFVYSGGSGHNSVGCCFRVTGRL